MTPFLQYFLPHVGISEFGSIIANCEIKFVKNYIIKNFIKKYNVNMSEAEFIKAEDYINFNDFFTRKLKPNARTIEQGENNIICPADGKIAQIGDINDTKLIQAKGHDYSLEDLLGGSLHKQYDFSDGKFATVYLAPHNYHRVHMPVDGKLLNMTYVPGRLFSVNIKTSENIPNLFARNERVICVFETKFGKMALILVGAMIVGSMETVWSGTVNSPRKKTIHAIDYTHNPVNLKQAEEMGLFKLGSTVIMLFEKDRMSWDNDFNVGKIVEYGSKMGCAT